MKVRNTATRAHWFIADSDADKLGQDVSVEVYDHEPNFMRSQRFKSPTVEVFMRRREISKSSKKFNGKYLEPTTSTKGEA